MLNKTIARYCIISMIDIKVKCLCKFKKLSSDGENEKMQRCCVHAEASL